MSAQSAEIVATQWNHLPTFGKVKPPSDKDRACLDAIRDVLVKHDCLDRFGVTLLHKHFDMAPDEILVEEVHQADRTLVTKPVKVDVVRAETPGIYETQWHWRPNLVRQVLQFCVVGGLPQEAAARAPVALDAAPRRRQMPVQRRRRHAEPPRHQRAPTRC